MSREYCRYCNVDFISGGACRTERAVKNCAEYAALMAENEKFQSAPGLTASQNSAERDPSVMPDWAGAGTLCICQKCKSPLAAASIMGTAGLCDACVPGGFERASSMSRPNRGGEA